MCVLNSTKIKARAAQRGDTFPIYYSWIELQNSSSGVHQIPVVGNNRELLALTMRVLPNTHIDYSAPKSKLVKIVNELLGAFPDFRFVSLPVRLVEATYYKLSDGSLVEEPPLPYRFDPFVEMHKWNLDDVRSPGSFFVCNVPQLEQILWLIETNPVSATELSKTDYLDTRGVASITLPELHLGPRTLALYRAVMQNEELRRRVIEIMLENKGLVAQRLYGDFNQLKGELSLLQGAMIAWLCTSERAIDTFGEWGIDAALLQVTFIACLLVRIYSKSPAFCNRAFFSLLINERCIRRVDSTRFEVDFEVMKSKATWILQQANGRLRSREVWYERLAEFATTFDDPDYEDASDCRRDDGEDSFRHDDDGEGSSAAMARS